MSKTESVPNNFRVAVIGAGASGIAAAIKLKEAGIKNVVVYEKADKLGGTWRDNIYPGLTCDVPSHLYRFTFAPNPDWTQEYATGGEILSYIQSVAEAHGIMDKICYRTNITQMEFVNNKWVIFSSDIKLGEFDAVISAMGVLHKKVYPDIEGMEAFSGKHFHSAEWDPAVDLTGKRVGIIGTGSTAAQILPAILEKVEHVSLFQRTPQWIINVENKPISAEKREKFRRNPEMMEALYQSLGEIFNLRFANSLVGDNEEGYQDIVRMCQENLDKNVHDPELRRQLTPHYAAGCKRLIVSDKFYPAIQQENANLVTSGIKCIEPVGIRTVDGELHECDVLIYATGFDPFNFFRPTKILGTDGQELGDIWEASHRAYRSVAAPGFPNLFFLGGPNSPIGNFSFLMTAEVQLHYIMKLIKFLEEGNIRKIMPTKEATETFNDEIEQAMSKTIWVTGGCNSWYFDKSGKVASWPWSYERFRSELDTPQLRDFEVN